MMNTKVLPRPVAAHRPAPKAVLGRSLSSNGVLAVNCRSFPASVATDDFSDTSSSSTKSSSKSLQRNNMIRQESVPFAQGPRSVDARRRASEDPAMFRKIGSSTGRSNCPPRPRGPAPDPPTFASKTIGGGSTTKPSERRQRSVTTCEQKMSTASAARSKAVSREVNDSRFRRDLTRAERDRESTREVSGSRDEADGNAVPELKIRHRAEGDTDKRRAGPKPSRPRSSPNALFAIRTSTSLNDLSGSGYPMENFYYTIDEGKIAGASRGGGERTIESTSVINGPATSNNETGPAKTKNLSVADVVAECERQKLTLPASVKITEACLLGGKSVSVGTEATLCALHQRAAAQLADYGQCIIYESVDGTAPVNCLYEVVRGSLAAGSRPNYLWSTKVYSTLRQLLAENPSRRRLKLTTSLIIDEETTLKKHEELLVACDDIVADALAHVPCWRLSISDSAKSPMCPQTSQFDDRPSDAKLPWRVVELVMVPLDTASGMNVCVNSDLLRLRDVIRRFSPQLPVRVLACEYVAARPAPFAMSGDPSVQLRLSTLSELLLQAVIKENVLLLLVDGVATLVSESQPFRCDLAETDLPDTSTVFNALSSLATQSLLIRQNYVQAALPTVRFSTIESSSVVNGEDASLQEGIYMDMSGGVYGQVRTESFSSTLSGTKPYRSITLDASVAIPSMTESMEERASALSPTGVVPPPLPGDNRPTLRPARAPTIPATLPKVAKDGYVATTDLVMPHSKSPSPDGEKEGDMQGNCPSDLTLDRHPTAALATKMNQQQFTYPSSSVVVRTRQASQSMRRQQPLPPNALGLSSKGPHYYKPFNQAKTGAAESGKAAHDSKEGDGVFSEAELPPVVKRLKPVNRARTSEYRRSIDDMDAFIAQRKERQGGLLSLFRRKPKARLERSATSTRDKVIVHASVSDEIAGRSVTLASKVISRGPVNFAGPSANVDGETAKEDASRPKPVVKPYRSQTTNDADTSQSKSRRPPPPPRPYNPPSSKAPPRPSYLPPDSSPVMTPSTGHGKELGKSPSRPSIASQSSVSSDSDVFVSTGGRELFPSAASIVGGKIPSPSAAPRSKHRPGSPSRSSALGTASRAKSDSSAKVFSSAAGSSRHMSVREPTTLAIQELETISASMPCETAFLGGDEYSVPRINPATGLPILAVFSHSESPSPPPTTNLALEDTDESCEQSNPSSERTSTSSPSPSKRPPAPTFTPPPAPPGKPPRAKPSGSSPTLAHSTSTSTSPPIAARNNPPKEPPTGPVPTRRQPSGESHPSSTSDGQDETANSSATAGSNGRHNLRVFSPESQSSSNTTDAGEPIYSYSKLTENGYGFLDNTPPAKAPKPKPLTKPKPKT